MLTNRAEEFSERPLDPGLRVSMVAIYSTYLSTQYLHYLHNIYTINTISAISTLSTHYLHTIYTIYTLFYHRSKSSYGIKAILERAESMSSLSGPVKGGRTALYTETTDG